MSKVFKRHPPSKRHIFFYSDGLAILHGLPDIGPIEVNNADCWPFLIRKLKIFRVHLPPENSKNGSLARFTKYRPCENE